MPVEITMPKLGLTMATGTIARWMKSPGDTIVRGEPLLEVATEKINYEVESPATGTLGAVVAGDGEEFPCGAVLGTIALAGEDVGDLSSADLASVATVVEAPLLVAGVAGVAHVASGTNGAVSRGGRILASPAARRLARERDVPLRDLAGTGPRGRITLSDIHGYRSTATSFASAATHASSATATHASGATPVPHAAATPSGLDPKRRAIYRKMSEVALLPLASVATDVRVDAVRALIELRRDFGWTAFIVYAVARLLMSHPELRTDASTGKPFEKIDIGVAADTPHGLIVPVVRNAQALALAHIHSDIVRLAGVARDGGLQPTDVGGACFSISNVGPQKVERVTPLVDPPQTAILGVGAATERPAVVAGAVVPAWMMTCILSFDHRFIDGAPAARFLAALSGALADPGTLL